MISSVKAVVEQLGRDRLDGLPLSDADRMLKVPGTVNSAVGYDIQFQLAAWLTAHGQGALAGYKIGATAKGMQEALGVPGPVYGHVLSGNVLTPGASFSCNPECCPGVECEIAFRLAEDLRPQSKPHDRNSVAVAIDAVLPTIEIVENRYGNYRACSLALLTADDFFHKACVIGEPVTGWRDLDLKSSQGCLVRDGDPAEIGVGSDVLGDPLNVVVWLANKLAERGEGLKAGQIISTGSMTPVHWIDNLPARIDIRIDGVGTSAVVLVEA